MLHNPDPSNIHVITENGEQCFVWRSNQLTYIAQDRQELPFVLANKFGNLATKLDLSYNTLTSYKNINLFTNLSELILDNNCLTDDSLEFKQNLRLKTLSLNKNKLTNLHQLIISIKDCFPNLEFLSLIGNPLCPIPIFSSDSQQENNLSLASKEGVHSEANLFNGKQLLVVDLNDLSLACSATQVIHNHQTDFNYQKYRHFIIYHLPNLSFLDSSLITDQERDEALKRCYWMENSSRIRSVSLSNNPTIQGPDNGQTMQQTNSHNSNNNNDDPPLIVMSDYTSNGQVFTDRNQPKGAFSRLSYKYTGKNSEGNRFIRNRDL